MFQIFLQMFENFSEKQMSYVTIRYICVATAEIIMIALTDVRTHQQRQDIHLTYRLGVHKLWHHIEQDIHLTYRLGVGDLIICGFI